MPSLYANLLDPSSTNTPGTISRAPVVFKQPSAEDAQPDDPAAAAKQKALNIGTLKPKCPSETLTFKVT
jgi:splicing factor 45